MSDKPKTAFDYRRYMTLVQVLAGEWVDPPPRMSLLAPRGGHKGLLELCEAWGVEPIEVWPDDGSRPYYNMAATLQALAQHVVAYHQDGK